VYALGHRRRGPIDLAAAAVLACGKGAVLSDLSAAAPWGFAKRWPEHRPRLRGPPRAAEVDAVRQRRRPVVVPSANRAGGRDRASPKAPWGVPPAAVRREGRRADKSEFEDRFVILCKRHDLPTPETNVLIDGRVLDAFFRAEGVIVELDSYAFH
jgi:hypothetical protein